MKLSMHSAKDVPISYINNNKGEILVGSFSSVIPETKNNQSRWQLKDMNKLKFF